jgi:hypothetical protein
MKKATRVFLAASIAGVAGGSGQEVVDDHLVGGGHVVDNAAGLETVAGDDGALRLVIDLPRFRPLYWVRQRRCMLLFFGRPAGGQSSSE